MPKANKTKKQLNIYRFLISILVLAVLILGGLLAVSKQIFDELAQKIDHQEIQKSHVQIEDDTAAYHAHLSFRPYSFEYDYSKKIGGKTYQAIEGSQNYSYLIYEFNAGRKQVLSDPLSIVFADSISNRMTDFWLDYENQNIYLVESRPESSNDNVVVYKISVAPSAQEGELSPSVSREILFQSNAPLYTQYEIASFNPQTEILLVSQSYGDGCGRLQNFITVSTQTKQAVPVVELALGCGNTKAYGGFLDENTIVVADLDPLIAWSPDQKYTYKRIYTKNVWTGQENDIDADLSLFSDLSLTDNTKKDEHFHRVLFQNNVSGQEYEYDLGTGKLLSL